MNPTGAGAASFITRLQPESFPHPIEQIERVETALSWLLLTGRYAYKVKKPVQFDYLDASSLQTRHQLCLEELRLNRRFSPDLYLDVLPIVERDGRPAVGAGGEPIEYCVRMQQFDRQRDLEHELAAGRVSRDDMVELARRLAAWHAQADADTARYGTFPLVRAQVLDNFSALGKVELGTAAAARLQRLEAWSSERLRALRELLEERRLQQRVRECHGDLHAGNIVRWHGRLQLFDCLEFDPALRWSDVASEVAFLFMDLICRGRADLAFDFVSAYAEQQGDYQFLRLLSFFGVYRALVRAKVDALAPHGNDGNGRAAHRQLRQRLRRRIATALHLAHERRPVLLLMHGVSGSGKSWLSAQLIGALRAVRVRSDMERRRLFGSGAYQGSQTDATYRRLQQCATEALAAGLPIIVDASFLQSEQRRRFIDLAAFQACPCIIIDCRAPSTVLFDRVEQRQAMAHDPSEATASVLRMQLRELEPLTAAEAAACVRVDTNSPDSVSRAIGQIASRLRTGGPLAGVSTSADPFSRGPDSRWR